MYKRKQKLSSAKQKYMVRFYDLKLFQYPILILRYLIFFNWNPDDKSMTAQPAEWNFVKTRFAIVNDTKIFVCSKP